MRVYASAAYASLILFITLIKHPSHARQVEIWPDLDTRMWKGDARMWRDSEDSSTTGKKKYQQRQLFLSVVMLILELQFFSIISIR